MWISYCCRQDPRAGSLKKDKKRRRRFGVGLNEGGKETSLWSRQKFVRRISSVHAHAQPYNPMNLVLSFLSMMQGSSARQPSGVLLCVFPPRSRIDRDMDANLSTSWSFVLMAMRELIIPASRVRFGLCSGFGRCHRVLASSEREDLPVITPAPFSGEYMCWMFLQASTKSSQ